MQLEGDSIEIYAVDMQNHDEVLIKSAMRTTGDFHELVMDVSKLIPGVKYSLLVKTRSNNNALTELPDSFLQGVREFEYPCKTQISYSVEKLKHGWSRISVLLDDMLPADSLKVTRNNEEYLLPCSPIANSVYSFLMRSKQGDVFTIKCMVKTTKEVQSVGSLED
jgi:hypothetical protein